MNSVYKKHTKQFYEFIIYIRIISRTAHVRHKKCFPNENPQRTELRFRPTDYAIRTEGVSVVLWGKFYRS